MCKYYEIMSNHEYQVLDEVLTFKQILNRYQIVAALWGDEYGENADRVLVKDEGDIVGMCSQWGFFERDCPGHEKDSYSIEEFRKLHQDKMNYEEFGVI